MFTKNLLFLIVSSPFCWCTPVLKISPIYEDSFVWINSFNESIRNKTIFETEKLFDIYNRLGDYSDKIDDCSTKLKADKGKFCPFDIKVFESCNKKDKYGVDGDTPCIFLYLDNVDGWTPQTYELEKLPTNLTSTFEEDILEQYKNKNIVWLQCEGVSPVDEELIGPLTYYPQPGFETKYITSEKLNGRYYGPLVALKFLRVTFGVVINIRCQILAPNIPPKQSSLTFEFIADED